MSNRRNNERNENMKASEIKVGSKVKLKRGHWGIKACPAGRKNNKTSKVCSILKIGVYLEDDLHGCRYWNQADLELA